MSTCPICQGALVAEESTVRCPSCDTAFHRDCWGYNGGCAIYGCPSVPPTDKLEAVEIPAGYWGQQDKACPACGQTILAAAVRCRNCGTTFATARPQEQTEFQARNQLALGVARVQRISVWLLVFSALPCTAALAAVVGSIWYVRHRPEIRAAPRLPQAMCRLAVGLAIAQTVLMIAVAALHGLIRR